MFYSLSHHPILPSLSTSAPAAVVIHAFIQTSQIEIKNLVCEELEQYTDETHPSRRIRSVLTRLQPSNPTRQQYNQQPERCHDPESSHEKVPDRLGRLGAI